MLVNGGLLDGRRAPPPSRDKNDNSLCPCVSEWQDRRRNAYMTPVSSRKWQWCFLSRCSITPSFSSLFSLCRQTTENHRPPGVFLLCRFRIPPSLQPHFLHLCLTFLLCFAATLLPVCLPTLLNGQIL